MSAFFSIVVVSFNAGEKIKHTIDSILSQTFDDYEIVVKDGLSTDNTLSLIPNSPKIRIYSEKDSGIYDAMNQAIKYCDGKYIVFINCGDKFYSDSVLSTIYNSASKYESTENIIYGDLYKLGNVMNQMRKVTARKLYRITLCHQTLFYGADVFKKYGLYDTSFKICADYEHIIRVFRKGVPFSFCDCIVVNYEGEGFSEKKENSVVIAKEHSIIRNKYYSAFEIFVNKTIIALSCRKLRAKIKKILSGKGFDKFYRKVSNFLIKKGLL